MTRLYRAWVAALTLTIIAGIGIAADGPTRTTALVFAVLVAAVVAVPYGLVVLQEAGRGRAPTVRRVVEAAARADHSDG